MFDSWWHHNRFGNKKSLELLKFKGFFITLLFASTAPILWSYVVFYKSLYEHLLAHPIIIGGMHKS